MMAEQPDPLLSEKLALANDFKMRRCGRFLWRMPETLSSRMSGSRALAAWSTRGDFSLVITSQVAFVLGVRRERRLDHPCVAPSMRTRLFL